MIQALLLSLALALTATRDGENLNVYIPQRWQHVEIITDPPAEFTEVEPGRWQGKTTAYSGTITGTFCEGEFCELMEDTFKVETRRINPVALAGLALLAGFMFNLSPCLLPVLPLKIMSLQKGGKGSYVAGVFAGFTALAVCSVILGTGLSLLPFFWYRVGLAAICILMGLSLIVDYTLPSVGYRYRGQFFAGLVSVLLGTACLVPFLTPVLFWCSVLPTWMTFVVFWLLAAGFLLPLLVKFPLPKPGAWLRWLNWASGVALLGVGGWLLSTALPYTQEPVSYPTSGPRVIVVGADWCMNCHAVEVLWEIESVQSAVEDNGSFTRLDYTNGSPEVKALLEKHGVKGIPFALIENRRGEVTVLSGMYTSGQIARALD